MAGLIESVEKFIDKGRPMKNSLLQKVIDILRQSGKIPAQYTGKVVLVVNISQGGVSDATLITHEKMK